MATKKKVAEEVKAGEEKVEKAVKKAPAKAKAAAKKVEDKVVAEEIEVKKTAAWSLRKSKTKRLPPRPLGRPRKPSRRLKPQRRSLLPSWKSLSSLRWAAISLQKKSRQSCPRVLKPCLSGSTRISSGGSREKKPVQLIFGNYADYRRHQSVWLRCRRFDYSPRQ